MFTLHLIGLACSSPLPASGRRIRDRQGGEEVRTGRYTMTAGMDHKDLGLQLWRAIAAKNHQHLINQRNLQSTNESCNQLLRY